MAQDHRSRRGFLIDTAGILSTTLAADALAAPQTAPAAPAPRDIVAALGDAIIPTDGPDYPGYARLEPQGISARVLSQLRFIDHVTPTDLAVFNQAAVSIGGKTFLESDAAGRASWLEAVLAPPPDLKLDAASLASAQKVLKTARERILTVFYRNFPYDTVDRDENGFPIPNKPHEIFDLKKGNLVTGWDIAGYRGPLSWEEEEERRERFKKILWEDE
jgi:hypothetical protein